MQLRKRAPKKDDNPPASPPVTKKAVTKKRPAKETIVKGEAKKQKTEAIKSPEKKPEATTPSASKANKNRLVKQIQTVVASGDSVIKPSVVKEKQEVGNKRVSIVSEIKKRGINSSIEQLGANPIKRVARKIVNKGISKDITSVSSSSSPKKVDTKVVAKAVVAEIKRIGSKRPSEVAAKFKVARQKEVVHTESQVMKQVRGRRVKSPTKSIPTKFSFTIKVMIILRSAAACTF
jgi:hypothetical protein